MGKEIMKHIKPYKLFENQEILKASLENAVRNSNLQLIKDMVEEYNLDLNMDDNFAIKLAIELQFVDVAVYLAKYINNFEYKNNQLRNDNNILGISAINIIKKLGVPINDIGLINKENVLTLGININDTDNIYINVDSNERIDHDPTRPNKTDYEKYLQYPRCTIICDGRVSKFVFENLDEFKKYFKYPI